MLLGSHGVRHIPGLLPIAKKQPRALATWTSDTPYQKDAFGAGEDWSHGFFCYGKPVDESRGLLCIQTSLVLAFSASGFGEAQK